MDLQVFKRPLPEITFDDIIGNEFWKNVCRTCILKETASEFFAMPDTLGFLLCGVHGTGKTTFAQAFAGEMAAVGYEFISLTCDDLKKEEMDSFFEFLSSGEKYVVLIDGKIKKKSINKKLIQIFSRLEEKNAPVILVLTALYQEDFYPEWKSKCMLCQFELPNEMERRTYFDASFDEVMTLESGFTYLDMAKLTEGFDYLQLFECITFSKVKLLEFIMQNYLELSEAVVLLTRKEEALTKSLFEEAIKAVKRKEKVKIPKVVEKVIEKPQVTKEVIVEKVKTVQKEDTNQKSLRDEAIASGDFEAFKSATYEEKDPAEVKKDFFGNMKTTIELPF